MDCMHALTTVSLMKETSSENLTTMIFDARCTGPCRQVRNWLPLDDVTGYDVAK
jgi:hypothetical protein